MLANKRYRNSCTSVKTYPGADINSDHVPVVGNFKVRMNKVTSKSIKKYDVRKLKDPNVRLKVSENLNTKVLKCKNTRSIEESITIIQETVRELRYADYTTVFSNTIEGLKCFPIP
ncbi:unnamed protein product [Diabrotica balteata]|uniref:Uncharacterized protein n=1 Tax=Diabrotica balteata TaxID=107213 RepID=A0A9N9X5T5_DIABA|nr:unnamed protein product [Diabrotica balteata]